MGGGSYPRLCVILDIAVENYGKKPNVIYCPCGIGCRGRVVAVEESKMMGGIERNSRKLALELALNVVRDKAIQLMSAEKAGEVAVEVAEGFLAS